MQRRHSFPIIVLALSAPLGGALWAGCASQGDAGGGVGGSEFASSSSGAGGAGGNDMTGSGGAGGATGVPFIVPTAAPLDTPGDAGTDAPPLACASLDPNAPTVLSLSADDSNSMASPVLCRSLLAIGVEPSRSKVRTYEFLNYYQMNYPAADQGKLAFYGELEPRSAPGAYDFQIALRSYDVLVRRPMNLTFVIDGSGSMQGPGIENARVVLRSVAEVLQAGDMVSVVTWSKDSKTLLTGYPVSGPNDPGLLDAADKIVAGGYSDLLNGLAVGYELAEQYRADNRMNRVVLISDGGANFATTDEEIIAKAAEDAMKEGIYLVGVGTGPPISYNDNLMNTVTERGHGAYVYLDNPDEAKIMFGPKRFDETTELAARSVEVKVTLPWYFRLEKFYGEASSTGDEPPVEPQHLAPNDAMIFHQTVSACDPSVVVGTDKVVFEANWKHPITYASETTTFETTVQGMLDAQKIGLPMGRAIVAYAEALKQPTKENLQAAHDLALLAQAQGGGPAIMEILSLLEKHPKYK